MHRVLALFLVLLWAPQLYAQCYVEPSHAKIAFPTAEGFGKYSVGGRGGSVCYVTTLADSGAGSLRDCMTRTGPRTVLFQVSGTIVLTSVINVGASNSYVTVAGQTAPGGGIQLKNYGFEFENGFHDAIIRHVRFRAGSELLGDNTNSCCGIDSAAAHGVSGSVASYNIIYDHCSFEWGTDENIDISYNTTNVTIQWSILAEGHVGSGSDSGSNPLHSMGSNSSAQGETSACSDPEMLHSFYRNVLAQNVGRNPLVSMVLYTPGRANQQRIDFRNNIVANWGSAQGPFEIETWNSDESTHPPLSLYGGSPAFPTARVNVVNNLYQSPGASEGGWPGTLGYLSGPYAIYMVGNGTAMCPNGCDAGDQHWDVAWISGQDLAYNSYVNKADYKVTSEHAANSPPTIAASALLSTVLPTVGATKPSRDSVDARIVSETQNGTGSRGPFNGQANVVLADYPDLSGGTAPTDTDGDGIPDSWETAHGLNPNNASDGPAITASGYSNLEVYLNELAGDGSSPTEPQPSKDPLYLSAGGHGDVPSDSYTCTEAQTITTPFATWAKACTCLQGGQVLRIRGGTYQERIDMSVCPIPAGTAAAPTVIRAYDPGTGPEVVTFQLPVGSSGERVVDLVAPAHLQFKYLIFDGANRSNSAGVFILGGGNVLFEACEVKNVVHSLLYMENVTTVSVKGTKISSTSSKNAVNLAGTINAVTLEGNEIASAALSGVNITTGTGESATSVTLVGNLIHNTGTGGAVAGVAVGSSTGTVLQNNVVYSNTKGIQILSGATGTTLQQNTVSKSTGVGVLCDSGASGAVVQNNLVCGNTTDTITNGCGLTLAGQGNITSCTPTAVYANYAANNFTLAASSPAINTGMALPALITDYLGAERPQQGSWDVGAYESVLGPEPIQTYATRQATGMLY